MIIEMEWIDRLHDEWKFAAGFSSVEAAKASARKMRKPSFGSKTPRQMYFRIYVDKKLKLVSVSTTNQLRWFPGNGKTREEMRSGDHD